MHLKAFGSKYRYFINTHGVIDSMPATWFRFFFKTHYIVWKQSYVRAIRYLLPMIVSVMLMSAGCTSKSDNYQLLVDNDVNEVKVIYEGRIHFDANQYLNLIVQLNATSASEGSFELVENIIDKEIPVDNSSYKGFYNIRVDNEKAILILENTSRNKPLRRTSLTSRGTIREENFRNEDLKFYLKEDHLELIEGDEIISEDGENFLYKRNTPEFTIEGYMTYRGDTSFFYETNTKIIWPLTKLGSYTQAAVEHNTLADKKNDTTYLKATAYAITVTQAKRKVDALVLKKIIQSSPL